MIHPATAELICETDRFLRTEFEPVWVFRPPAYSPCRWGVGGTLPPARQGARVWIVTAGLPDCRKRNGWYEGPPVAWIVSVVYRPDLDSWDVGVEDDGLAELGVAIREALAAGGFGGLRPQCRVEQVRRDKP